MIKKDLSLFKNTPRIIQHSCYVCTDVKTLKQSNETDLINKTKNMIKGLAKENIGHIYNIPFNSFIYYQYLSRRTCSNKDAIVQYTTKSQFLCIEHKCSGAIPRTAISPRNLNLCHQLTSNLVHLIR